MFDKIRRFFGFKEQNRSLEDKLFINILVPRESRDYFKWMDYK